MAVPGGVLPPAMGGVGAHVVPIPHASHAASVPHAPHVVPVSRAVPATSQKQLSAWEKHKLQERNGLQQASEERVHATRAAIEAERKKQTQAAHACAEADAALQALLLEAEALSTTLAGMQNASPPSEEDIEKLIASEIQADNDKMVGQTQMLQKLKDAVEAREQVCHSRAVGASLFLIWFEAFNKFNYSRRSPNTNNRICARFSQKMW